MACFISSSLSGLNSKRWHLERMAGFMEWKGLAVVAPIRIILPFSTWGSSRSCLSLLRRCTSSQINTIWPLSLASAKMASRSFLLPLTALKRRQVLFNESAITLARVVLPVPGGPKKMDENISPFSTHFLIIPFSPTRCFWPTMSSSVFGLRR